LGIFCKDIKKKEAKKLKKTKEFCERNKAKAGNKPALAFLIFIIEL